MTNSKIIDRAVSLGFQFNDREIEEDLIWDAMCFIENNLSKADVRYECEVSGHGNHQHVSFGGYECSGEIVDFAAHWHDSPGTEVNHTRFVDEDGQLVELYYKVPETEYNTPISI